MLEIIPPPQSKLRRFRIPSDSNALVRSVRENVARECSAPVKRVRLLSNGKELSKDSLLLRDTPLSADISVNVLQVMISHVDLNGQRRSTGPPAEALPRSLLSRQPGAYDVLLQLVGAESAQPYCLLLVYRCTCTHSPHPLPWPGHLE